MKANLFRKVRWTIIPNPNTKKTFPNVLNKALPNTLSSLKFDIEDVQKKTFININPMHSKANANQLFSSIYLLNLYNGDTFSLFSVSTCDSVESLIESSTLGSFS